MKDIFRYSATVSQQNNRSSELAMILPSIIARKLENVVARDVKINGAIVTFHGGASRSASKRKRLVTNWNLVHIIARGAIQVTQNFPNISIVYWLGFPKLIFSQIGIYSSVFSLIAGIFLFIVQQSIRLSLLLTLGLAFVIVLFMFLSLTLYLIITLIRFNLFIKHCIYEAEKQIKHSVDLTLTS